MTRKKHYVVLFSRLAQKDYASIKDKKLLKRINVILEDLETNPFSGKPLHGEFQGCRSIKTFSFRIVYEIGKSKIVITVLRIQHRKESYR
ncbi:MAG: type II toxin-antitoxin system RelE/ParE family toxin [Candidatus Omnitrophota bacterium]